MLATQNFGRRIPSSARAKRREQQQERLVVIEGVLRDRSDAALRNVQNMEPDQAMRITLGGFAPDRMHGNSHDGSPKPPALRRVRRCLVHTSPASTCTRLALPSSRTFSPAAALPTGEHGYYSTRLQNKQIFFRTLSSLSAEREQK